MDSNHRPHAYQACALTSWAIGPYVYNGAGEGNRTLVISLEGWGFTTKLHPHKRSRRESNPRSSAWQADMLTPTPRDHCCYLYCSMSNILRGQDLNLWPSGYEPDELPTAPPRDNINVSAHKKWVKEDKGFEPLRAFTHLTVFKTVPFSRTWVILHDLGKY